MKSKCPACGVSYAKHLGLTGTCEELQLCKLLLTIVMKLFKEKSYEKNKTKPRK